MVDTAVPAAIYTDRDWASGGSSCWLVTFARTESPSSCHSAHERRSSIVIPAVGHSSPYLPGSWAAQATKPVELSTSVPSWRTTTRVGPTMLWWISALTVLPSGTCPCRWTLPDAAAESTSVPLISRRHVA